MVPVPKEIPARIRCLASGHNADDPHSVYMTKAIARHGAAPAG
jgi:hypothetical protein